MKCNIVGTEKITYPDGTIIHSDIAQCPMCENTLTLCSLVNICEECKRVYDCDGNEVVTVDIVIDEAPEKQGLWYVTKSCEVQLADLNAMRYNRS